MDHRSTRPVSRDRKHAAASPAGWLTAVLRPAGTLDGAAAALLRLLADLSATADMVVVDLAAARVRNVQAFADALRLPLAHGSVDGATCGFALRNVTEVTALFAETARVLRPRGRVAFLETSEPDGRLLRAGHAVYFKRIVPLIGGALSDRDAYRYLPRSMAYLPEPARLLSMLADAGFAGIERIPLGGGVAQLLVGTRR